MMGSTNKLSVPQSNATTLRENFFVHKCSIRSYLTPIQKFLTCHSICMQL